MSQFFLLNPDKKLIYKRKFQIDIIYCPYYKCNILRANLLTGRRPFSSRNSEMCWYINSATGAYAGFSYIIKNGMAGTWTSESPPPS